MQFFKLTLSQKISGNLKNRETNLRLLVSTDVTTLKLNKNYSTPLCTQQRPRKQQQKEEEELDRPRYIDSGENKTT